MNNPLLECSLRHSAGAYRLEVNLLLHHPRTLLWGASGAGKTTLLRLLAGLLRPSSGFLSLGGRSLVNTAERLYVPPGQRRIGLVTQDPALFPHLDVRSNIAFGLAHLVRAERRRRADHMLELFDLAPLATRAPAGLSGGELRRVALARALAPQPTLLLLDEPFAALDQERRAITAAALESCLAREEISTLAVSHDLADAFAPGPLQPGDVVLLSEGRIIAQGPPGQVLARERARLLARLGVDETRPN